MLAVAAPAQAANEPRATSAPSYVGVPSLSASISRNYRAVGMVTVDFGLDVPDAALRGRVQGMMPRLRDAWRTALADYAANRYEFMAVPDADQIARMLQQATDRTLGVAGARITLTSIMVQPSR